MDFCFIMLAIMKTKEASDRLAYLERMCECICLRPKVNILLIDAKGKYCVIPANT